MSGIKMRRRGILSAGYTPQAGPPSLSASHVWWADDLAVADGGDVASWTDRVAAAELTSQSSLSGLSTFYDITSPPKMAFNSINGQKAVKFSLIPSQFGFDNVSTPLKANGISFTENKGCIVILGFANANVRWSNAPTLGEQKHYQYDFDISGGTLFELNTSTSRATSRKRFSFLELPGGIPGNGPEYINTNVCLLEDPASDVDQFGKPNPVVASGQVPAAYNSVNGKPFIFEISTTNNNIIDSDYEYSIRENNFLRFTRSPNSAGSPWDNLDEFIVGGNYNTTEEQYLPTLYPILDKAYNWNGWMTTEAPGIGGFSVDPSFSYKDLQIAYIGIFPDALTELERIALYDWFELTYSIPVAPTVAEEDFYPPNISNKLYRAWAEDIYVHHAYDDSTGGGSSSILNRTITMDTFLQQNLINNKSGIYNSYQYSGTVNFTNSSGSAIFVAKVGNLNTTDQLVFSLVAGDPNKYVTCGISPSGKVFIAERDTATENRVEGNTVLSSNDTVLLEYSSTGSAFTISVNNVVQTLTVVSGSNNGNWFDKMTGGQTLNFASINNTEAESNVSVAYVCFTSSIVSSQQRSNLYNWMLNYYDENSLPFTPIYWLSIYSNSYTGYEGNPAFRERKASIDSRGMLFESNNPTYLHDIDFYPLVNEEFTFSFRLRDLDSGPRSSYTPDLGPLPQVTGNIIWGDGSPNTPFTLPSVWGNGTPDPIPEHTYTTAGTYNIQIQMTDPDGGFNTQMLTAHVSATPPDPICDPIVTVDTSAYPTEVLLDIRNCRDLRDAYKVTIDWDDNTPNEEIGWNIISNAPIINHYYGGFGTRTITVTTIRLDDSATPVSASEQIIVNLGDLPAGGPEIPSAKYIWFADDLSLPGRALDNYAYYRGYRSTQFFQYPDPVENIVYNWYDRVDGIRLQSITNETLPTGITLYPPQLGDNNFSGKPSIFSSNFITLSNAFFSMDTFLDNETIRPLTSSGSMFALIELPFHDGFVSSPIVLFGWQVIDPSESLINRLSFSMTRLGPDSSIGSLNDVQLAANIDRDIAPTSLKYAFAVAGGAATTSTRFLVEITSDGTNLTFRLNNNLISRLNLGPQITNEWSSFINATGSSIKKSITLAGNGLPGIKVALLGMSETPLTSTERTNLLAWAETYYGIDL